MHYSKLRSYIDAYIREINQIKKVLYDLDNIKMSNI